MITPAEALERLLAEAAPIAETEQSLLADAAGRTLATDLAATRGQPPFAASAMDGYAVRAADLEPGRALKLVGEAAAGRAFEGAVGPGDAVRIFTGAPLPPGTDTVLIQENAEADADHVRPRQIEAKGRFVRPAALDFRAGDVMLQAGSVLAARHLGLAAAMGHAALPVIRKPRIAVIATGDELVWPGETPRPHQIYLSNTFVIAAMARAAGAEVLNADIVPDDAKATRAAVEDAARTCDIIVTSGGASVGEHDFVQAALTSAGFGIGFWKIALRPGKPFMMGRRGRTLALGLPGNPVSSAVCSLLFLNPLIRFVLGQREVKPRREPARLGAAVAANDMREEYMRCALTPTLDGLPVATPLSNQDSSLQSVFALADALLIRSAHAPAAEPGELCDIIRL
jgi:molybdopterin molybdotransferase